MLHSANFQHLRSTAEAKVEAEVGIRQLRRAHPYLSKENLGDLM